MDRVSKLYSKFSRAFCKGAFIGSGPGCLASNCVRELATCFFNMVIFEVESLEIKSLVSGS